jgi:hypothetical protein
VALDNGTRDEVLAYQVRIPNSVVQGDHVRLTVRPVTGEVLSVVVLDHRGAQSGASPEAAAT